MKTVYGSVSSWRLGRSFGIDLICRARKICSFDCIYCQLGKIGRKTLERKVYVQTEKVLKDFEEVLPKIKADVITFAGTGEPTLAQNLEEIIDFLRRKTSLTLAILTNSTLFFDEEVQKALNKLDIVVAKLDAFDENSFKKINRPAKGISFEKYLQRINSFRKNYSGKFALQMMFIKENKNFAVKMAEISRDIKPDEIQINTPLRPCGVRPLIEDEIKKIKENFSGSKNVISVYEARKPRVHPINIEEIKKRKRPNL